MIKGRPGLAWMGQYNNNGGMYGSFGCLLVMLCHCCVMLSLEDLKDLGKESRLSLGNLKKMCFEKEVELA